MADFATKQPKKEGFLEKNGKTGLRKISFGLSWKKRWIVLVDGQIKYFEKKVVGGSGKAQGEIYLQEVVQICGGKAGSQRVGKDNGILVHCMPPANSKNEERIFEFAASNSNEQREWVEAMQEHQKETMDKFGTKYMRVHIMSAQHLPSNQPDAYCVIKNNDGREFKTEIITKNSSPEWDQTFTFVLSGSSPVELVVKAHGRIYDSNVGTVSLDPTKFTSENAVDWHLLTGAEGAGASLQLGVCVGESKQDAQPEVDPLMDFYLKYVKRDASGQMVVEGLPASWEALFKKAGITAEQLKNPNVVGNLVKLMNDALADSSKLTATSSKKKERSKRFIGKCKALYDFDPQQEGDLGFKTGDIINIIKKDGGADGWWTGQLGDRTGSFPYNYVKEMERKKRTTKSRPQKALPPKPATAAPSAPSGELPKPPTEAAPAPPSEPAPPPPTDAASSSSSLSGSKKATHHHHDAPLPPTPGKSKKDSGKKESKKDRRSSRKSKKDHGASSASKPSEPAPTPTPTAPAAEEKQQQQQAPPTPPTGGPPPPPPSAPVPPPTPPANTGGAGGPPIAGIQGFDKSSLKKAETNPKPAAGDAPAAGGLLAGIQSFNKGNLKKAEKRELDDLNEKELNSLVGILSAAMGNRRDAIDDSDSDNSDWDDDDWE